MLAMPCTLVCSSCCLSCRPIRMHGQILSHRSPGSTEDGTPMAKLQSVLYTAANKSTLTCQSGCCPYHAKHPLHARCLVKGEGHLAWGPGGKGGQPDCMQTSRSLPVVAVYICFRTDSKPGSTAEHAAMQGKCSTKCHHAQPQDTASSTVEDLVR